MADISKPENKIQNSLALTSSEDILYDTHFVKARILVNVMNKEDKAKAIEWLTHLLAWLKKRPINQW